jgi:hypothetical protein
MGSVNFATFDPVTIGADLALSGGNLILQTSQTVDAHRMARSTFAVTTPSNVEFIVYAPTALALSLAPVGGVPPVIFGIATVAASLAKYVGEDANAYGYCPGDGYVYKNNAQLQFVGTSTYGDVVTLVIDPANTNGATLTVLKNNAPLGSPVSIGSNLAWYFAATVSGDPGTYGICANSGVTPLRYVLPKLLGFSQPRQTITPIYLATEPYIAKPTDALPHNKYAGDVDRSVSPTITRSVKFWPQGKSAPVSGGSTIEVQILDPSGTYRLQLKAADIRDLSLTFSRLVQDAAQSTAENVMTALVDRIANPTDQTVVVYGKDKLALLQSQLVRPLFPPTVDAAFAGKPRPLALGICRTFSPPCYDSLNLNYALSDGTISAVGRFRDQGVVVSDYNMLPDGASIHKTTAPTGKFTCETSSTGAAFNPTAPDALTSSGVFGSATNGGGTVGTGTSSSSVTIGTGSKTFTVAGVPSFTLVAATGSLITLTASGGSMTGTVTSLVGTTLTVNITSTTGSGTFASWTIDGGENQPTGWGGGGGYPTAPQNQIWQLSGTSPNKTLRQANTADAFYWLKHKTFTVPAGASYAFSINVTEIPYIGPVTTSGGGSGVSSPAHLVIGGIAGSGLLFMNWTRFALTRTGVYTGVFTNNTTAALPLVIGFDCNSVISNSYFLGISSLQINSVPSLTANVTLQGPGLDDMLRALLIGHGPYSDADYNPSGARAIDTATAYQYGLYVRENETPQVEECVRKVLNSACADLFVGRDGRINVVRLIAPESVDISQVSGSLTPTDIKGMLTPSPDLAEGLTTRLSGCPNIDKYLASDFANVSQTDVPQAVRIQLMQDYQWTVPAGVQLSPSYSAAYNEDPLATQFDIQAHGQAEASRVNALYSVPRNFYEGDFFSPIGRQFEIGQVWTVTYPLPGLETGRQLMIVGISEKPADELSTLTFWGL